MTKYIEITISDEDIEYIAEELNIDREEATKRVQEWASAITDTASSLVNEQIYNVIEHGQP